MFLFFKLLYNRVFPKKEEYSACTPCGIGKTVHYDKNFKSRLIK